jgi:hypothetical protein
LYSFLVSLCIYICPVRLILLYFEFAEE